MKKKKIIREINLSPFFSVSGIGNIQDEKDMIKVYESYVECGKITCWKVKTIPFACIYFYLAVKNKSHLPSNNYWYPKVALEIYTKIIPFWLNQYHFLIWHYFPVPQQSRIMYDLAIGLYLLLMGFSCKYKLLSLILFATCFNMYITRIAKIAVPMLT